METRRSTKCLKNRTPQEIVMDGLLGNSTLPGVDIVDMKNKGRGVVVTENVPKGTFLCDYGFSRSYPRSEKAKWEKEYATNEEPCMILEVLTSCGWICLDATRATSCIGRLMNHSSPSQATAKPFRAMLVNGEWRVGFLSTKDLVKGEELTWNYGCQPEGQEWLYKRPRSSSSSSVAKHLSAPSAPVSRQAPIDSSCGSFSQSKAKRQSAPYIDSSSSDSKYIKEREPSLSNSSNAPPSSSATRREVRVKLTRIPPKMQEKCNERFFQMDEDLLSIFSRTGFSVEPSKSPPPKSSITAPSTSKSSTPDPDSEDDGASSPPGVDYTWRDFIEGEATEASQPSDCEEEPDLTPYSSNSEDEGPSQQPFDQDESDLRPEEARDQPSTSKGRFSSRPILAQLLQPEDSDPAMRPPPRTTRRMVWSSSEDERKKGKGKGKGKPAGKESAIVISSEEEDEEPGPDQPSTSKGRPSSGPIPAHLLQPESSSDSDSDPAMRPPPRKKTVRRVVWSSSSSDDEMQKGKGKGKGKGKPAGKESAIVISSEEDDEEPGPAGKKTRKPAKRRLRLCPIAGCRSKPQRKLANHLTYAHSDLSPADRWKALKSGKVVAERMKDSPGLRPVRGQVTLEKVIHKAKRQGLASITAAEGTGSTRGFLSFNGDHPVLVEFREWLMGIDGGEKSLAAATGIVRDVSKFLRMANSSRLELTSLFSRQALLDFLDALKKSGIGCDGRSTKLDNLSVAIKFAARARPDDISYDQEMRLQSAIQTWKKTLRKERKKKAQQLLERQSTRPRSLEEITRIVDNPEMWRHFDHVVSECRVGAAASLSQRDLKLAMGAVLVTALLKSFQRPGAVANATLMELEDATEEEDGNHVIRVLDHKTQIHGSAKLIFNPGEWRRLRQYLTHVRPHLVGKKLTRFIFVREGGAQVEKVHSLIRSLGKEFCFEAITATQGRKIGATSAIRELPSSQASLVTVQMRHSAQTEMRHYQAIVGASHASSAYRHMEDLRAGLATRQSGQGEQQQQQQQEEEVTTKTRRPFTDKETAAIAAEFAVHVKEDRAPTLSECAAFLKKAGPVLAGRSAKNVQDKIKNLRKNRKK